jgi:hypothetical protein
MPFEHQIGWTANDASRFWPSIEHPFPGPADVLFERGRWWSVANASEWFTQRAVADITGTMFLPVVNPRALAAVALVVIAAQIGVAAASIATTAVFIRLHCHRDHVQELPFRLFAPLQVCFVLSC